MLKIYHPFEKNFYPAFCNTTRILFICFILQSQAKAEINPMLGTLETRYRELSHAGDLTGCELSFETITQDFAYKNGKEILGIGSISLNLYEDKFGLLLKLGTLELKKFMEQNPENEMTAPNYIFLKTKNLSSAGQAYVVTNSDSTGFKLLVLKDYMESLKLLDDLIQQENFTIGFNRKENGMDVYFPVDTTVKETIMSDGSFKRIYSKDALSGFSLCFSKMLTKVSAVIEQSAK